MERTNIQNKLIMLWQEVLNTRSIDENASFLKQGGNSLRAVRLALKIQEEFKYGIDSVAILDGLTLNQLSRMISDSEDSVYSQYIPVVKKEVYDLSYGQSGIYVSINHSKEDNLTFNMVSIHEITGKLDLRLLQTVFFMLISRHEILRTVFTEVDGLPKQKVLDLEEVHFKIDHRSIGIDHCENSTIQNIVSNEMKTPFDLENGPLIRVLVLSNTPQCSIVLFSIHHLICDGISMQILAKEIFQLYLSFSNSQPITLQPLRIQFKDYAEWQNGLIAQNEGELRKFWLSELSGRINSLNLDELIVPESQRSYATFFNGKRLSFELSSELAHKVNIIADEAEATVYSTLMASIVLLLHFYSGQNDIIVGTILAGREHRDLLDQMGMYVNILPLRIQLHPDQSFNQLLRTVKDKLFKVSRHQVYPLNKIIDDLDFKRNRFNPLFNIVIQMIEYETEPTSAIEQGDFRVKMIETDLIRTKFNMIINIYNVRLSEKLAIDIIYDGNIFDQKSIARMKSKFLSLVGDLTTNPDMPGLDICLGKLSANSFEDTFRG